MDKEYYIKIDGQRVAVSKEIYYAFKRQAWREQNRKRASRARELSVEALADIGVEIQSADKPVDEAVEDKILLDVLMAALRELTAEERELIDLIFYQDKTERQIAKDKGISKTGIHKQKEKTLSKLRKLLKNR